MYFQVKVLNFVKLGLKSDICSLGADMTTDLCIVHWNYPVLGQWCDLKKTDLAHNPTILTGWTPTPWIYIYCPSLLENWKFLNMSLLCKILTNLNRKDLSNIYPNYSAIYKWDWNWKKYNVLSAVLFVLICTLLSCTISEI